MLLVLLLIAALLGFYVKEQQAKKRKEQELQRLTYRLLEKYQSYETAVVEFDRLFSGFVAHFPLNYLKSMYQALFDRIDRQNYKSLTLTADEFKLFDKFMSYIAMTDDSRDRHNADFVKKELLSVSDYLDTVVPVTLDGQQRRSIIVDEDNNLVVAGAGSGKTTTIVGKVKYLTERQGIDPASILLISFTRKAVESLASKVQVEGVLAKTFHSFGLEVLREAEHRQSIFEVENFPYLIESIFDSLMDDELFKAKVTEFFVHHYKLEKDTFSFKNQGEQIQALKDENFQPFQLVNRKHQAIPLRREKVKSYEECKIANFLFLNNVEYEYEAPYERPTATYHRRQYKPDFTIFSQGERIYLEHFGVDRQGVPAPFFSDPSEYVSSMNWKRSIHKQYGTRLVETYSFENSDGVLLSNLERKLRDAGVALKPKTPEEVWKIINSHDKKGKSKFLELLQTFIVLLKSNNSSFKEIRQSLEDSHEMPAARYEKFLEIIKPVFDQYQKHLYERMEIDYSDMINRAADYILQKRYSRKFQYIVVDEFQDLSKGRYRLIDAIKKDNPFCKLFAVGDDWQSIYRFAGSDISLFSQFGKFFGISAITKIETTYRFSEPLIKISSDFVLKNPSQIPKRLTNNSKKSSTIQYMFYSDIAHLNEKETDARSFVKVLTGLLDSLILASAKESRRRSVLILGRYNYDINKILKSEKTGSSPTPEDNVFRLDQDILTYTSEAGNLEMKFLSVHKAKGLESDIVIIINNDAGEYGFPSLRSDDPLLNSLLSDSDHFENGEERRLFYVAITRAREQVFCLINRENKSKFIAELTTSEPDSRKCPKCLQGDIVRKRGVSEKSGKPWAFESCSNYAYGCKYLMWI